MGKVKTRGGAEIKYSVRKSGKVNGEYYFKDDLGNFIVEDDFIEHFMEPLEMKEDYEGMADSLYVAMTSVSQMVSELEHYIVTKKRRHQKTMLGYIDDIRNQIENII